MVGQRSNLHNHHPELNLRAQSKRGRSTLVVSPDGLSEESRFALLQLGLKLKACENWADYGEKENSDDRD